MCCAVEVAAVVTIGAGRIAASYGFNITKVITMKQGVPQALIREHPLVKSRNLKRFQHSTNKMLLFVWP